MIGIVVVTHAGLAAELRNAAELILGPLAAVETITIARDMAVERAKEQLVHAIRLMGSDGDGVMILTDLFGGTPTNISVEFLESDHVEILTGVNLPMLIKCISARSSYNLDSLAEMLRDYARTAIMRPADLLK
jgi:mannose PTS system EIIA component